MTLDSIVSVLFRLHIFHASLYYFPGLFVCLIEGLDRFAGLLGRALIMVSVHGKRAVQNGKKIGNISLR